MNLLQGDTPKQKHDNLEALKKILEAKWSDEIRLEMIEKAHGYTDERVYHYGYYDGYHKALSFIEKTVK